MSAVRNFLHHVSASESLQHEIAEAVEDKEGKEAFEAIVELAQLKGFDVSIKDVASAFPAIAERNYEQELSDTELEGVSGGISLSALFSSSTRGPRM